jgi:hypothetical protein
MTHNLLPIALQEHLKTAAKGPHLDAAIATVQAWRPDLFHTEESLTKRVFHNQPRGNYSGTFINAAPPRI